MPRASSSVMLGFSGVTGSTGVGPGTTVCAILTGFARLCLPCANAEGATASAAQRATKAHSRLVVIFSGPLRPSLYLGCRNANPTVLEISTSARIAEYKRARTWNRDWRYANTGKDAWLRPNWSYIRRLPPEARGRMAYAGAC